ncbi:MAG TPA: LemA family protein [Acidimicrobiales bacterium]|nr:LemA family protein [Acidimicrobiales bacterium]
MIWIIVVAVVIVLFLLWLAVTFNRLVRKRNQVADAWAGIDVQLTRRANLVPNLVEVVKGYRDFERTTLEQVVEARSEAINAKSAGPAERGQAEQGVGGALKTVFAVAEAYPDLQANKSFLSLQTELATLEEDIAFSRRYYNAQVRDFNTRQQTFPTLLLAGPLGFTTSEYFQADNDEREAPRAQM